MMNLPDRIDNPGAEQYSSALRLGECLRETMAQVPDFYFFSPDETTSNKLDAVYESAPRAWTRQVLPWDRYMSSRGRVVEMLSENTLFATLVGHILSGGHGAMTSYEAFFTIISSQLDQYLKFIKQCKEISWRPKYHALNLLSTSCWQRQDHNGYSHQSPALITSLLSKPSNLANCLFPVDDVATAAAWEFATHTKDVVNLITFNKTEEPRWIDINHAHFQLTHGGASVFQFISDDNPDFIIAGIGDIPTKEAIAAIRIVKHELPDLRLRFVGIAALSYGAIGTTENKLKQADFDDYFTPDKPILANFHGYPDTLRAILSRYADNKRLNIHGYEEQGSTTTPLDELTRNSVDRYSLAIDIFRQQKRDDLAQKYQNIIQDNAHYAALTGTDAPR